jgi:hypothetical protein
MCSPTSSNWLSLGLKRKPWAGIEPATFALPRQRSGQAELPRHFINKKYQHNLTISIQQYFPTSAMVL